MKNEEKQEVARSLKKIYRYLKQNKDSVIRSFSRSAQFYDEPPFYLFHTEINVPDKEKYFGANGEGFSFESEELAALKALMEGFERFSLYTIEQPIFTSSINALQGEYLHPSAVVGFSANQLSQPKFQQFHYDQDTEFGWVKGQSLSTKEQPTWLPAQLIYLTYPKPKTEPTIHFPLSTGAAAGTSKERAIANGIYEIVERDAFMITYLNRLNRPHIDLMSHPDLKQIALLAKEYHLEPHIIDISTDLDIYSFVGVLVDKTGKGPVVSLGLKSGLHPLKTMIGAFQEAFHPRPWIRSQMIIHPNHDTQQTTCRTLVDRALFWTDQTHLQFLSFLLSEKTKVRKVATYKNKSGKTIQEDLRLLLHTLAKRKLDIYYVDITPAALQGNLVHCVKVLIPQLHPLYLDDLYPYWGGKRLYEVPPKIDPSFSQTKEQNLFRVPHPFL
jgi:ribosomal protein S12 methylthiotransferase accessory factor